MIAKSWAIKLATEAARTVLAVDQIIVARQFSRAFIVVKPEEYQDLRGFYQKVATQDQQQLVLTLSAPAKGN